MCPRPFLNAYRCRKRLKPLSTFPGSYHDQLHGVFVHGQKRPFRIIGPVIQIQKILHASYECGVFLGRNHPARFQRGLEFVFLSARCTVRQEMLSTMLSSTSLSASNSSGYDLSAAGCRPRRSSELPFRRPESVRWAVVPASSAQGLRRALGPQSACECLPRGASVARKRWGDGFVAPARAIRGGLHQNVSVSDPVGLCPAFAYQILQVLPLIALGRTMYFLLGMPILLQQRTDRGDTKYSARSF